MEAASQPAQLHTQLARHAAAAAELHTRRAGCYTLAWSETAPPLLQQPLPVPVTQDVTIGLHATQA